MAFHQLSQSLVVRGQRSSINAPKQYPWGLPVGLISAHRYRMARVGRRNGLVGRKLRSSKWEDEVQAPPVSWEEEKARQERAVMSKWNLKMQFVGNQLL